MSDPLEKIYQEIFADAIEYMKKHEVQAIVGKDDEEAEEQGYKPFIPKDERDV